MDRLVVLLTGIFFLVSGSRGLLCAEAKAEIEPKVMDLLRQTSQFYAKLKSFSTKIMLSRKVEADGIKQKMTSTYIFAVERPNKVAFKHTGGLPFAGTIVCDGEKVYKYLPFLNKYTEEDAPENIERLSKSTGALMMCDILGYLGEDALDKLLEGVKGVEYKGIENYKGSKAHRLKFHQDDID